MKKFLALMLAAVMLILPGVSFAESAMQTALGSGRDYHCDATIQITEGLLDDEVLSIVNGAGLGITAASGDTQQLKLTASAGGAALGSAILEIADDAVYLGTDLLGGSVRIGEETLPALIDMTCEYLLARGYAEQADIDAFKSGLEEGLSSVQTIPGAQVAVEFSSADFDLEKLAGVLMPLAEKIEMKPASEYPQLQGEGDPFETVLSFSITGEEFAALVNDLIPIFMSNAEFRAAFEEGLQAEGVTLDELKALLPQILDEIKTAFADGITLLAGMDANGEIVCARASANVADGQSTVGLLYDFVRMTSEGTPAFIHTFAVSENEAELMKFYMSYGLVADGFFANLGAMLNDGTGVDFMLGGAGASIDGVDTQQYELVVTVLDGEETMVFGLSCNVAENMIAGSADAERNSVITLYVSPDGTEGSELVLGTLTLAEYTAEPALETIVSDSAFRPESLSQEDFNGMLDTVVMLAQMAIE